MKIFLDLGGHERGHEPHYLQEDSHRRGALDLHIFSSHQFYCVLLPQTLPNVVFSAFEARLIEG